MYGYPYFSFFTPFHFEREVMLHFLSYSFFHNFYRNKFALTYFFTNNPSIFYYFSLVSFFYSVRFHSTNQTQHLSIQTIITRRLRKHIYVENFKKKPNIF